MNGLKQLLTYVVKNTFLANGDFLRQQKKGVPIGADAGPELANLYLFAYESAFIDRLESKDILKARSFHLSFRKIDDLLLVDNPNHELALKNFFFGGWRYLPEVSCEVPYLANRVTCPLLRNEYSK